MKNEKHSLWIYGAVLLVGFVLRLYYLGEQALWFDEAIEFWTAYVPFSKISHAVKEALRDPPLYSYILHFWMKLSISEVWLRLFSVIVSIAGIIALMKLGIKHAGYTWGWIPGFFVALAKSDIRFAQEVGQYALAISLIAWSMYFLDSYMHDFSKKSLIFFSLFSSTAIYTYYGSVISLGMAGLTSAFYLIRSKNWKAVIYLALAGVGIGVSILPLILYLLPVQLYRGLPPQPFCLKGERPIYDALAAFPGSISEWILYQFMAYVYTEWSWEGIGSWIIWLPSLLLIAWGIYATRGSWIFSYLIAGILVYYAISRWGLYPFGGRYSLVFAPAFWMSLGWATAMLLRAGFWKRVIGFLILLWAALINIKVPPESLEDLHNITERWLSLRKSSDTSYVYYGAVPGLGHQLLRKKLFPPNPPEVWYLRCWSGDSLCWQPKLQTVYGRWIRDLSPAKAKASILQDVRHATRFWFIASHMHPGEVEYLSQGIVESGYEIKFLHNLPKGFLCLFEAKPDSLRK